MVWQTWNEAGNCTIAVKSQIFTTCLIPLCVFIPGLKYCPLLLSQATTPGFWFSRTSSMNDFERCMLCFVNFKLWDLYHWIFSRREFMSTCQRMLQKDPVCYKRYDCVSPKFIDWNPNPQCDNTDRWLGLESKALLSGISALKKDPRSSLAPPTI